MTKTHHGTREHCGSKEGTREHLRAQGTFEKKIINISNIFVYFRKRSRINEETYEKQHNKLEMLKTECF